MGLRIRKFKRLYEEEAAVPQNNQQPAQPAQQPAQQQQPVQQQGQQQPAQQQGQQQSDNAVNGDEIKNQVNKASQTILQTMLEAIEKNVKPIKGVTQEDQSIPGSKECAAAYNTLVQKKDFATIGQFLTALNAYANNIGGQQGQQQGQQNQQQPAQQQPAQQPAQQQPAQQQDNSLAQQQPQQ